MAKGSVRKKGKKWYYRFYVEDESGRQVQREFAGTENKSETEALLRQAMADYEAKKFVAKSENATVGPLLDRWVEEELKPGNLSNGTVMAYQGTVNRIKQHPIGNRKLKSVTPDHLQAYIDLLSFGGTNPDGTAAKALSKGYLRQYSAVLQGAFRFAVFPKRLISFNPMQYVVWRGKKEEYELFSQEDGDAPAVPTLTHEQFRALEGFLKKKDNPALLPIQIAYYTGLRIGGGLRSHLAGHQPGRAVSHGAAEYPLQRGEAQDGDWGHQAEESPDGGLLRHAGGDSAKGQKGADWEPPALWGALQPELLHRGQGER